MRRIDKLKAGKFAVDADLVRRLIASQFPAFAGLEPRGIAEDGWDNWTFRLGDDLKVRLPSAEGYAGQPVKEYRWLPILAPQLPLRVPAPVALGEPEHGYPWRWTIYDWIDDEPVRRESVPDLVAFAADLASFLNALHGLDASGGPPPGEHNFFRGGDVIDVYGEEARRSLAQVAQRIDLAGALSVLDAAEQARFSAPPCWLHGDVAVGNLLARDGRLSSVIDFGSAAIGDPACDLVIAWLFFGGESRRTFHEAMMVDEACWARARAWALWKAALVLASGAPTHAQEFSPAEVIAAVVREHRTAGG